MTGLVTTSDPGLADPGDIVVPLIDIWMSMPDGPEACVGLLAATERAFSDLTIRVPAYSPIIFVDFDGGGTPYLFHNGCICIYMPLKDREYGQVFGRVDGQGL